MAACLRACLATSNLVILQSTLLSPPPSKQQLDLPSPDPAFSEAPHRTKHALGARSSHVHVCVFTYVFTD
ncbi:hypothetical protein PR001_g33265 [Phytophthora rubi]|uniref:Secreted protein n=1 Tax=Phytophthora rubi TaxID=129364 RepID=A0A6A3G6Z8_9STRA|nr:hypothetical protein PR001_g33265 [Phytophthora rubi]